MPATDGASQRLSQYLVSQGAELFAAIAAEPFVRALRDGSLPRDRFLFWLAQDCLFLADYGQALALAVEKSPDCKTQQLAADLLHDAVADLDGCRCFAAELGFGPSDLDPAQASVVTRSYADFLLRIGAVAGFVELAVALLPCVVSFARLRPVLNPQAIPADHPYARAILLFWPAGLDEITDRYQALVDSTTTAMHDGSLPKLEAVFLTALNFDLQFWRMGWEVNRRGPVGEL